MIVLLWILQFGYHFGKLLCSEMIPLVLAPSGGTPEWAGLDGVLSWPGLDWDPPPPIRTGWGTRQSGPDGGIPQTGQVFDKRISAEIGHDYGYGYLKSFN